MSKEQKTKVANDMMKKMNSEDLKIFQTVIDDILLERATDELEKQISGKFVYIQPEVLKIRQ